MHVETDANLSDNLRTPINVNAKKSSFGALVEERVFADVIEKTVTFPSTKFWLDPSFRADVLNEHTDKIKQIKYAKENGFVYEEPIYTCADREPGSEGPASFG